VHESPARSSTLSRLPLLVVIVILGFATIFAGAIQLSEPLPLSPWESALAMEAMRLNAGLPIYEPAHATHLYGPLLTIFYAGVFRLFGFNLIAARICMSIFALATVALLSAMICRGKSRNYWLLAVLLFFGINFRTNLVFFSMQPDCAAAFFAALGLYFWIASSPARRGASIIFFLCAALFKQTSAAIALIPIVHAIVWKRPVRWRELAIACIPTMSILLMFGVILLTSPMMFAAMVIVPASIKIYPERAFNIAAYLLLTFPIFLIALLSIFRSRAEIAERERWILSALMVLVPISIWTLCKSGSDYNSLLFAYLAMTALCVARLDAIAAWLSSLSIQRRFIAAIVIAIATLASFFLQFNKAAALLLARWGDEKYGNAVALARKLDGVVTPQDPTIALRAQHFFGRSLFLELDAHAVNGNWPAELPMSILHELADANYIIAVRGYVPTPMFESSLARNGYRAVAVPELANSVYTLWEKTRP
jgi:hypothetical protein